MAAMTVGVGTMTGTLGGRVSRNRAESVAERNRDCFERQRRALRGGTPEVFFVKHLDNTRIVKAEDPERRAEMRMFTYVMCTLFALAMVYVWQHFSAIEMGYQLETQRAQVETLRESNRQLRLTEAQLSEPKRIDHIARQLGMDTPRAGQVLRNDGMTGQEGATEASIAAPGVAPQGSGNNLY